MNTKIVEIPPSASEQVARIQLEEMMRLVKQARAGGKNRVRVTIQQDK